RAQATRGAARARAVLSGHGQTTGAGCVELALVPFPSWPLALPPQQRTVPALVRAQVCFWPTATETTGTTPEKVRGKGRGTVASGAPTWPASLSPQQWTKPSIPPVQAGA